MITETTDFKGVQSLLYEDELVNAPMIRLLNAPPADLEIWLDSTPRSSGVLFIQPPQPGTWDAAQYPKCWQRVWIQSLSTSGVDEFIDRLPSKREFLFKFHRPWIAAHLMERLSLEWKGSLFYFMLISCDFVDRREHDVIELAAHHIPQAIDLFTHSGRMANHLQQIFVQPDTAVFGVFQGEELISGAFVEPRTQRTMEICALQTRKAHQGEGLATSVVSVATRWILDRGKLPVYAARKMNVPSIRLAQRIGYRKYGRIDHYYFATCTK